MNKWMYVGFGIVLAIANGGCSQSKCSLPENMSSSDCQPIGSLEINVTRILRNGNTELALTNNDIRFGQSTKVELLQTGATSITLWTSLEKGLQTKTITQQDLDTNKFQVGAATLTITDGENQDKKEMWIYIKPKYTATSVLETNPGNDPTKDGTPHFIGIGNQKILSLNDFNVNVMTSARKILQYTVQGTNLAKDMSQPFTSIFEPDSVLNVSTKGMVVTKKLVGIVGCDFTSCNDMNSVGIFQMPAFVVVDPLSTFYAWIDSNKLPIVAKFDGMTVTKPTNTMIPLDKGAAASLVPSFFASGDLNKDGLSDLILWGETSATPKMEGAQVFLQKMGGGFVFDAGLSQKLQEQIGTDVISALAVGDINADQYADVVIARGKQILVIENQAGTSFVKDATLIANIPAEFTGISSIAIGALTNSMTGLNDIAIATTETPKEKGYLTVFLSSL